MDFRFTIKVGPNDEKRGVVEAKSKIREANNWVDVPLAAIPVIQKGWPEMPNYMDGRQYFLWFKNGFKLHDDSKRGEVGTPNIHNPLPSKGELKYEMGGESSRKWGA